MNHSVAQINAYLTFDGNCREAMTFYHDCFGGELTLQTIEGSPMADNGRLVKGNTISLSLNCRSETEIKSFFSKLSSGGQVVHPLHRFFAGTMGTITDKFEKDWLLYFEKKLT